MSIFIVIVLYKQKIEHGHSFKSLLASLKNVSVTPSILLYDNSPNAQLVPAIENVSLTYFHNPTNGGVSEAYNYAAKQALKVEAEWLMLLDQDTVIEELFFQKLTIAINSYPDLKLFAPIIESNSLNNYILSPCKFLLYRGFRIKNIKPGVQSLKNRIIINSGAVINLKEFMKVGGYNPSIKLDFSDTEFFYRFSKYHPVFLVLDSVFQHDLSVINSNKDSLLLRHRFYVLGASYFVSTWKQYISLLLITFYRSLVLSLRFRNFAFIKLLIENFRWRNGSANTFI